MNRQEPLSSAQCFYLIGLAELYKESANFCGIEGGTESESVVDLQTTVVHLEDKKTSKKRMTSHQR